LKPCPSARTHHDVADPIEHEVGIGGVVVEAAFGRCGVEAKARQQPVGRFLETAHQLGDATSSAASGSAAAPAVEAIFNRSRRAARRRRAPPLDEDRQGAEGNRRLGHQVGDLLERGRKMCVTPSELRRGHSSPRAHDRGLRSSVPKPRQPHPAPIVGELGHLRVVADLEGTDSLEGTQALGGSEHA